MAITRPKKTQDQIQLEARTAYKKAGGFGTIAACTGAGKTKMAIDEIIEICQAKPKAKILVVVPTEKLRDINWESEFREWNAIQYYEPNVVRSCYASLNKIKDKHWDLVVLDEGHHITPNNLEFFENNDVEQLLVLTATFPKKGDKREILEIIAPCVYVYTLAEGVYDGVIDPFEIDIIYTSLNNRDKNKKAGNKVKVFYQTELQAYNYANARFQQAKAQYFEASDLAKDAKAKYLGNPTTINEQEKIKAEKVKEAKYWSWKRTMSLRSTLIKESDTKTAFARKILERFYNPSLRWLVFCGSIAQAESLCGENVFHSKQKKKVRDAAYDDFRAQRINILGAVNAINEGHNMPNLDDILVAQLNSQELHIIQRIGRVVRKKKGRTRPAKIRILCAKGTQDEEWVETALEEFDDSVIFHHKAEEYL